MHRDRDRHASGSGCISVSTPKPLILWVKPCRAAEFHRAAPQHFDFLRCGIAFLQHPCSGKAQTPPMEKLRPHRWKSSDPTDGKAHRNFAVLSAARISRRRFFGKDSLACFVM